MSTRPSHNERVPRLRFGPFEADLRSGELWRGATPLHLPPQPFRILALLVTHPGEVVTREEVRQHIWGDGTVVDFDQRLNAGVNQIRTVLGDDAETPRYVETLPRRGYRWVGPRPTPAPAEVVRLPVPADGLLPEPPRGEAPSRRRAGLSRAVAAALVVGLALLAFRIARPRPAPEQRWTRLTFQRGSVAGARFAPSGEVFYGAAWEGAACALYSAVPGAPDPRPVYPGGCRVVGVSPEGELAFLTEWLRPAFARVSLGGGPEKQIHQAVASADLSRDGAEHAVAYFVPGKTQMQIEWPTGTPVASADSPSELRIAPNGRLLAFAEHPVVGDDRGRLVVVDRSGRRVLASREWSSLTGVAWAPGGREVWISAAEADEGVALHAISLAGTERRLLPPDRRMVLLDVAEDGRALVDRCIERQEVVFVREGGPERNLSWLDMTSVVDVSRDGSQVLLNETGSGGGDDYGVYLRRTDGSPPLRVGRGRATALSPDARLVLTIPIARRNRIELLPIGPGQPVTIQDHEIASYEWGTFFPDGRRILFVGRERSGVVRMFVRELAAGPPRAISPENIRFQKFQPLSPDGALAVARCPDSDYCLYPTAGGAYRRLPGSEGLRPAAWEAGGRHILMMDRSLKFPLRLYRLEVATGRREPWRVVSPTDRAGVTTATGIAVAPDGAGLAYDYIRRLSELYLVDGLR
jgi:DNA-binding winged helix-turn-helix (wHTH) protein